MIERFIIIVKLVLIRAFDKIQKKNINYFKRKKPFSDEILWRIPMLENKLFRSDIFFDKVR